MIKICLVEDDKKVASFIKKGLEENEYLVDIAEDAPSAKALLAAGSYAMLILDVMLPGINGVDFCKQIRYDSPDLPILMLTALGTTQDKVMGLKAGADDYLVKPFHFDELLARIQALLRRQQRSNQESQFLQFADLILDTWSKTASRGLKTITLTAKEYSLLELLLKNPRRLLSRQEIADKVWGIGFDTGTNFVDVYVNYLRNKVDKNFGKKLIHTVIGMGYILKQE